MYRQSKARKTISYGFAAFWAANTPKLSRRASRAGRLHFPMVLLLCGHQETQKIPGALHAPDCFILLRFCCFLGHRIPQNFPARFARRIDSFGYDFAIFFGNLILQNSPGALRAPDFLCISLVFLVGTSKDFPGALRAPDLLCIFLVFLCEIPQEFSPARIACRIFFAVP